MSFDLFLQRFHEGAVSAASKETVLRTLRRFTEVSVDQFGFYLVRLNDGSNAELSSLELEGEGIFSSCAFHLRDFTPEVFRLVFELAVAGNMVAINPQSDGSPENPTAILFAESQREHLPAELVDSSALASSVKQFAALLHAAISSWQHYRARVVDEKSEEP